jgi:ATP-dependent Clp protease ATP-binding subunit ClpB
MHERVIGQSEAVSAVASALRRARTNLQSKNRPIATFLFMGPTGVGKTELTKTIASVYFGDDDAMVRLDMSEFQEVSSIQRLIGMMGSTEGGLLTEAVRQNPFTIVLLDEFEKASPQIMNLFLQVFDDGRLTDNSGRIIDFTNTILIATSNAGSEYIQEAVKRNDDISLIRTTLIEEKLKTIYSPEMLNRFDGVIVFKPLSQEDVVKITGLMIDQVKQRLLDKGIEFDISEEMIQSLAKEGYDPKFGARPLRRVIQEKVDNSLAKVLLEEDVKRRDKIIIDINGTRIERATEI